MKNRIVIITLALASILQWSCTDLEEERIDEAEFGGQGEAISGAIAPAYGYLSWTWRHTNYYGLQLIPSDEAILPQFTHHASAGISIELPFESVPFYVFEIIAQLKHN